MTHDGLLVLALAGPEVRLFDINHRQPHSIVFLARLASEGPSSQLLPAGRVAEGRSRMVLLCHDPHSFILLDLTGSRIPNRDWRSAVEIELAGKNSSWDSSRCRMNLPVYN